MLRGLLACAVLAHAGFLLAGPLPTTCHTPLDDARLEFVQVPTALQPGVPGHVIVRATNPSTRTWIGEEQKNFPYRLASWPYNLGGIAENQVQWSNWSCFGYAGGGSVTNQRAFISDVATPEHPTPVAGCGGRTVAPGATYDFSFDITTGNTSGSVRLATSMVYDAGQTCQGFFGDVKAVDIPVVSGPGCGTTDIGIVEGQWRLQVYNNEGLSGNPVEVKYVGPVGTGGFDFVNQWGSGASQCAGLDHYSTRVSRKVFFLAGNYDFDLYADDGFRLIVNNVTVMESWVAPQAKNFHFTVTAPVTGLYDVAVEHFQATGGAGLRLLWTAQTGTTKPNPPSNLTATALGGGQIRLEWGGVSGISSYKVKRTTSPDPNATFSEITTVSSTSFIDSGLPDGTYYYVVTAVDNAGTQSDPSNRASATLSTTPVGCDNAPKSPPDDGWLVEIYNNRDLSGPRPVETIQLHTGNNGFNFPSSSMPPSQCVGAGNYSMRFTRQADFAEAGNYKFTYNADDGIRARLNGMSFIDRWAEQVILGESTTVQISAVGRREIVVEYFQATGGAQVALQWALDSTTQPPPNKPTGLVAVAGDAQVSLTWDIAPGVDLYRVKRKECIACLYLEIATTPDGHYEDRPLLNGTEYTYVVQAWNFVNGNSPDSDSASARPRSSAGDVPTLGLEVFGPNNATVGPQLSLNSDGWAGPNPLEVRIVLGCPASRVSNCSGPVQAAFNSSDNRLRINGAVRGSTCGSLDVINPSNAKMRWICPSLLGTLVLAPGQTTTITVTLVVQPSEQTALNMNVSWGDLQASRTIGIPAAQIHPLIVIPGILGTMPPSYDHGEFDPQLGVYTPLMKQLEAIGYQEGVSLFRFPYDWRNTNHVTARYLHDRIRAVLSASRAGYVTTDRVDILAHSMGGLITRVYMQGQAWDVNNQNITYGNDIRKVIFAASPHRGFPEAYKTYESNDWSDFLGETWSLNLGMNGLLWPAFVKKHWMAANPHEAPPGLCIFAPNAGEICTDDDYQMSHALNGGIESLREMLPTPDVDLPIAPFFGPYLCQSYPPCAGPYPFAPPGDPTRPVNPLLPGLNAGIGALDPSNFYVIYGTDPSPSNSRVNDTDVVFDVKPGTRTLLSGWQNGEPEQRFTTSAGDDLIPEYSSNLKLLLPGIDPSHVAGFRVLNGVTQFGLAGPAFRHKEIMWSSELQAQYAPNWLAGLGAIPFYQPYVQPDVALALARGTGWALFGECPVNLLLTDLQRNLKLGYDPDTGIVYRDIPNSTYAAPNSESQFMLLGELPPGTYHLKVSAFGDGKFSLSLNQLNMAGTPRRWFAEDTVHTGEVREYDIVIGPQSPITSQPPIADAGPDQTVPAVPPACVADVQLDGSRSSDPDGEVLTYPWTGAFGYVTGVQPTVKLPVGTHDVTLLVQDGQRQGRRAHTHVRVTAPKPTINSVSVSPSILEPADGTMRSASVTVDVSAVCGTATCRIVDVDSDEGDKNDWKITGALSVKLRAERSPDGDGRHYKLRIECRSSGADPVQKSVTVRVPPPGRMKGDGEIRHDEREYQYKFDLSESRAGKDAGSVSLDVKYEDDDDHKHKDDHRSTEKFKATRVDWVRFSNDDDLEPGGSGIKVDTVKASGVGTWNGKAGYTFELRATDAGEPGTHHDRFKLVVRDAKGKSVAYVDEKIDSGNNQSVKPPK
jgi:hypothetical protein